MPALTEREGRQPAAPVATDDGLVVEGLEVRYGAVEALRGVDLHAPAGGAVAVVGPNGAGKTTLLRTLSGLVRARAGRARLDRDELLRRRPHAVTRLGLAHVPEGRAIIEPLTVRENLQVGAFGVGRADAQSDLDEMLELFPSLERRLDVAAGLLSGGEQQMLAIARGLMSRPKLLALDEPSMGLAPVVVDDVLAGLARARARGVGLLLVEQNLQIALECADHVCVLVNGRIVLSKPREEVPRDLLAMYIEGEA